MSTPSLNQINTLARKKVLATSGPSAPRYAKTRQAFEKLFATPEQKQALVEEVNTLIANLESRISPSTRAKRAAADKKWEWMVHGFEPDLPLEHLWDEETVMKYYTYMLPVLLKTSKGTHGREYMKASTLKQYMELFCWSIAKHTRNAEGNKCGTTLLSHGGLLSELDNILYTLTNQYDLNRTQEPKLYYSENELKLVVQEFISMSQKTGRLVTLQKLSIVLTLFFTSVRPGSLGPSNSEYEKQGKFPKLRDIKIFRLGFMTFKVELNLHHFKGHNNTSDALTRKYIFEPVVQWYNVHLDISLYYVAFLLARGALEGLSSVEDLRKSDFFEIKIKESILDEPLFLALKMGGKYFADDPTPMSALGITHMIRVVTVNAGMAQATSYSFRRGAANDYEVIIGKEFAEHLLTHKAAGALHFYSENTANIDIVGARLDEMPIPMDANRRHLLNRKIPASRAVQAVLYLLKSSSPVGVDNEDQENEDDDRSRKAKVPRNTRTSSVQITIEQKLEAETGSKEFRTVTAAVELKWNQFMACYPKILTANKKPYHMAQSNINIICNTHESKLLVPVEVLTKAVEELRAAFEEQVTVRRQIYRKETQKIQQDNWHPRKTSLQGTVDDINNAVQDLSSTTPLLVERPNTVAPVLFGARPQMLNNYSAPKSVVETAQTSQRPDESSSTFISFPRPVVPVAGPSDAGLTTPDISWWPAESTSITNSSSADINLEGPVFRSMLQFVKNKSDQLYKMEDEDEDEEPDLEAAHLSKKLKNLGGKRQAPPLEDPPSQQPCNITNTEPQTVNESDVKTPDVRSAYIDTLIGPIVIQTAFSSLQPMPNGNYQCPRCVSFFHHRPDLQDKTYTTIQHVWRHITTQHTAWKELVLLMIQKDSPRYHCPLGTQCTFIGDTEEEVLEHCIKECTGQDIFLHMATEHSSLVQDERTTRKGNVTNADYRRQVLTSEQQGTSPEQDWVRILHEESPGAYSSMLDDINEVQNHVGSVGGSTIEQFEQEIGLSILDLYTLYGLA